MQPYTDYPAEKGAEAALPAPATERKQRSRRARLIPALLCAGFFALGKFSNYGGAPASPAPKAVVNASPAAVELGLDVQGMCPQTGPIAPSANAELASALDQLLKKQENKQWFYDNLSGVIRIPYVHHCIAQVSVRADSGDRTQVYDDIPSPSTGDHRWDGFATLHKFFEERFPLMCVHVRASSFGRS